MQEQQFNPDDVVFEDLDPSPSVSDVLRTYYANPSEYDDGSSKWGVNVSKLCEDAGVSNSTAWRALNEYYHGTERVVEDGTVVVRPVRDEPESVVAHGEEPAPDTADVEAPEGVSEREAIPVAEIEEMIERYRVLRDVSDREAGGEDPEGDLDRALYRNTRVRRSVADQVIEDLQGLIDDV